MFFRMRWNTLFATRAALLAISALAGFAGLVGLSSLALAEGPEYRAPVEKPQAQPQQTQPAPSAQPAQPAQPGQESQPPQPKFPNKDTAKNRQDYEMGTDTGTIVIGRDAQTGEDVVLHVPPKKNQPQEPDPPIEVKPVVPLIWKR